MIILIPFSSLLFCPELVQAGNLALESVDACGGFCNVLLVCEVELSELEALGGGMSFLDELERWRDAHEVDG